MNRDKHDVRLKRLGTFYYKKSKEPKGGSFFKVINGAYDGGVHWGRDENDVAKSLRKDRVPFTSITELRT